MAELDDVESCVVRKESIMVCFQMLAAVGPTCNSEGSHVITNYKFQFLPKDGTGTCEQTEGELA